MACRERWGVGGSAQGGPQPVSPTNSRASQPQHPASPLLLAPTWGRTDCCTRTDFPAKEERLAMQEALIDATAAIVASSEVGEDLQGF